MSDVRVTILDINPVSYSVTRSAAFAVQVLGVPGGGGGGGATSFLGLGDTPSSYSGKGLMAVRVNEAGNALEFFDAATLAQLEGVASAFGELVDAIEALDDTVTAQGGTLTGLSTSLTNHANNLQAHGITTFGASLVSRANASAARTTLGAASAADVTTLFGLVDAMPQLAFTGDFADLINLPTTLAGYGITDAATASDLTAMEGVVEDILSDLGTLGPVAFSGSYDDLIDKPTIPGRVWSPTLAFPRPEVGDELAIYLPRAMTVKEIRGVLTGSSSPNVQFALTFDASRSASGTAVKTGGVAITSTTAGDPTTSFDNAAIPAGRYLVAEITSVSGDVDQAELTVDLEETGS